MHIGEFIKYRRRLLGYTQKQLADCLEESKVSKQAVCKWEKCLSSPDIMILPELAYALKKDPNDLTKIIWRGNREWKHTHLLSLSVTEKDGDGRIIKLFESDDFGPLADLVIEILKGVNDSALQILAEYYNYDNARTFQMELQECEYEALEDHASGEFIIDSFDITPLVVKYCNQSKTI